MVITSRLIKPHVSKHFWFLPEAQQFKMSQWAEWTMFIPPFSDTILTWHVLAELKESYLISWLAFLPTQILGLIRSELCARNQKLENFSWKLLYIWIGRYSRTSQILETTVALWLLDQTVSNCGVPHWPRVSLHAEPGSQRAVTPTPCELHPYEGTVMTFSILFTLCKSFLFDFFKSCWHFPWKRHSSK